MNTFSSSTTSSRTSILVWTALLCLTLTETRAFHHIAPIAMVGQTARREPFMNFGNKRQTTLRYSNNGHDGSSSSTSQQPRWWRNILSSNSAGGTATVTSQASGKATQQETVDAYLEFLDRRYRRLHSDEQQEQPASTSSSKPISFSAMDWLMNGSSSSSTLEEDQRKQEDALYVLGVAGLASHKLLQKHHLSTKSAALSSEMPSPSLDAIEVQAEADDTEDEIGAAEVSPSHVFIKKVLVPMIRAFYIVQRRKDQVVQRIQRTVGSVFSKAAQRVVRPVAKHVRKGPKAIAETLLELGGGKRNIAITLACAYTMVVLLRPILQAAVTEASVRP